MTNIVIPPAPAVVRPAPGRRLGYAVAIVVDACAIYVVQHVLEWGWPAWVTRDFAQVETAMTVSLAAALVGQAVFLFYDPPGFRSLVNAATNAVAFWATLRLWDVFPFDFTGYAVDWSPMVRIVLGIALVASGIGALVELIRAAVYPWHQR